MVHGVTRRGSTPSQLGNYLPSVSIGLSVVNAICTQRMRDLTDLGLTLSMMVFDGVDKASPRKAGRRRGRSSRVMNQHSTAQHLIGPGRGE